MITIFGPGAGWIIYRFALELLLLLALAFKLGYEAGRKGK